MHSGSMQLSCVLKALDDLSGVLLEKSLEWFELQLSKEALHKRRTK